VYRKENSQEGFITGSELSFDWKIATRWMLKTGAAWAYGQNSSYHEPMRRIPPFNGRIMLDYSVHRWQWAAEQLFASTQNRLAQGDKDDIRIPPGGTPGWNLINMYGSYGANWFHVRAGIQNLFNKDYKTHGSGINGIGRSAWLAIQINL
jgi:outer membrane receptor protein involved in Fe transport